MTSVMATQAQAKPEYLGLLNAISLAESRAGVYLKAWADVTPDPALKQALAFVAARETAHGAVFCQRIERLGFTLREREDPDFEGRLRLYGDPTISDLEKIRHPRYGRRSEVSEGSDPLAGISARIDDESVDPLTRDTLRWFVAEERDTGALLREAYARVEARANGHGADRREGAGNGQEPIVSADAQAIMACMTQGFAALQQSLKELTGALTRPGTSRQR